MDFEREGGERKLVAHGLRRRNMAWLQMMYGCLTCCVGDKQVGGFSTVMKDVFRVQ